MNKARVFWAVLGMGFGAFASAQTDSPVARVAAGLTLAQGAIANEDAQVLLTGIEMIAAHDPQGAMARNLLDTYQTEALFLIRGDQRLSDRFDRISLDTGQNSSRGSIWIVEGGRDFEVPTSQGISSFAAPAGLTAQQLLGAPGSDCVRDGLAWVCEPSQLQGRITLLPMASPPDWVVLETRPIAP